MRIMGLDIGEKRIGIALSDPLGYTSQGLQTLERKDLQGDLQKIADLIKEWEVSKLVVGLPRNMNGTYGPATEKVKEFTSQLTELEPIEVIYWDERLTTVAAQKTLIQGDMSRKKRKQVVDKIAAVLILQGYLDHNRG
ncbi:MAG: Holliday junction resolvase RuvX [Peptococcia bacterium]